MVSRNDISLVRNAVKWREKWFPNEDTRHRYVDSCWYYARFLVGRAVFKRAIRIYFTMALALFLDGYHDFFCTWCTGWGLIITCHRKSVCLLLRTQMRKLQIMMSSFVLPQVVDMTGPETKILTGYGSLAQQHAKPGEVLPTTSGELPWATWQSTVLFPQFSSTFSFPRNLWMNLVPILTTYLIHISLKGWENVLFELGNERVNHSPKNETCFFVCLDHYKMFNKYKIRQCWKSAEWKMYSHPDKNYNLCSSQTPSNSLKIINSDFQQGQPIEWTLNLAPFRSEVQYHNFHHDRQK